MVVGDHHKPLFNNLDGIRFVAFLCVFFSHTFYAHDPVITESSLYLSVNFMAGQWGDFGLSVFFVMSGFLITYLLMSERRSTGTVHVLSFYVRRILRIWPLYFAIVLFNFFVYLPLAHRTPSLHQQLPYYFFYSNMGNFGNGVVDHLWAISVEEQFYLVLPLVMMFVPDRKLIYVFAFTIVAATIFRLSHPMEPQLIFRHSLSASFEIALGGLAAWLVFFNEKTKELVGRISRTSVAVIYCSFTVLILFQNYIFSPSQLILFVLAIQLFALFIIVEQNYAAHSLFKIGNVKWVSNLGKYSYGFFCYHIICIRAVEMLAMKLGLTGSVVTTLIVPFGGLAVTLAVGTVSYRLFEIHFLNLKKRFSYLD